MSWRDLVFIGAVLLIVGWMLHLMKPEPIILHTDTSVLHANTPEDQATVPEVFP